MEASLRASLMEGTQDVSVAEGPGQISHVVHHEAIPRGEEELVEGVPVIGTGKPFEYQRTRSQTALLMFAPKSTLPPAENTKTFFAAPGTIRTDRDLEVEDENEWLNVKMSIDEHTVDQVLEKRLRLDHALWKMHKGLRFSQLPWAESLVDGDGDIYRGENRRTFRVDKKQSQANKAKQMKENQKHDEKELYRVLKGEITWQEAEFCYDRFVRGKSFLAKMENEDVSETEYVCRYRWEIRLEMKGTRYMRIKKEIDGRVVEHLAEMKVRDDGETEIVNPQYENLRRKNRAFVHWRPLKRDESLLRLLWKHGPAHRSLKRWPPNFYQLMSELRLPVRTNEEGEDEFNSDVEVGHFEGEENSRQRLGSVDTDTRSPVEEKAPWPAETSTAHARVVNQKEVQVTRFMRTWPGPDSPVEESAEFRDHLPPGPGFSRPGARTTALDFAHPTRASTSHSSQAQEPREVALEGQGRLTTEPGTRRGDPPSGEGQVINLPVAETLEVTENAAAPNTAAQGPTTVAAEAVEKETRRVSPPKTASKHASPSVPKENPAEQEPAETTAHEPVQAPVRKRARTKRAAAPQKPEKQITPPAPEEKDANEATAEQQPADEMTQGPVDAPVPKRARTKRAAAPQKPEKQIAPPALEEKDAQEDPAEKEPADTTAQTTAQGPVDAPAPKRARTKRAAAPQEPGKQVVPPAPEEKDVQKGSAEKEPADATVQQSIEAPVRKRARTKMAAAPKRAEKQITPPVPEKKDAQEDPTEEEPADITAQTTAQEAVEAPVRKRARTKRAAAPQKPEKQIAPPAPEEKDAREDPPEQEPADTTAQEPVQASVQKRARTKMAAAPKRAEKQITPPVPEKKAAKGPFDSPPAKRTRGAKRAREAEVEELVQEQPAQKKSKPGSELTQEAPEQPAPSRPASAGRRGGTKRSRAADDGEETQQPASKKPKRGKRAAKSTAREAVTGQGTQASNPEPAPVLAAPTTRPAYELLPDQSSVLLALYEAGPLSRRAEPAPAAPSTPTQRDPPPNPSGAMLNPMEDAPAPDPSSPNVEINAEAEGMTPIPMTAPAQAADAAAPEPTVSREGSEAAEIGAALLLQLSQTQQSSTPPPPAEQGVRGGRIQKAAPKKGKAATKQGKSKKGDSKKSGPKKDSGKE
ncbi:MAG: hypothetical protein M4579_005697 [Chaenotheca gracillima]|nr:MAG: hypothetical protein M4579_005697 [Chaenotheca gracillima]